MKAQPLRQREKDGRVFFDFCAPEEATHIQFQAPGPITTYHIPVQIRGTRKGTGNWTWNGDVEKPTLKPSILQDFRPHDTLVNHVWITDGQVIFLTDCSHELAGQTLDLLDYE